MLLVLVLLRSLVHLHIYFQLYKIIKILQLQQNDRLGC